MCDRDRAARARQQDEQAPRSHPGVSEDAPGDRIALAEIVQQPAVGAERAELPCERGEVESVEERHQPCRGSGGAARHSHTSPPVARQETWSIAPSKPTRRRSSSVNPAPYSAQAAPSGVACTASASPTRAIGTWLSRRSSPANTARAARRAATYPRARARGERLCDAMTPPTPPTPPPPAPSPAAEADKRASFEREALVHLDSLYRVALRLTGNPAEADDLVQETMLKAYRAWHQFERGTNAKGWLLTILRHAFINEYRRRTRHPETVDIDAIEPFSVFEELQDEDPQGTFFDRIVDDEVLRAIDLLPEQFRETVVLSDVEGMSYEEIARILEVPVGTVKSRLFRARRLLQQKLYDYAVGMGYIKGSAK